MINYLSAYKVDIDTDGKPVLYMTAGAPSDGNVTAYKFQTFETIVTFAANMGKLVMAAFALYVAETIAHKQDE